MVADVYNDSANDVYHHMHMLVAFSKLKLDFDANSCAIIRFVLIDPHKRVNLKKSVM